MGLLDFLFGKKGAKRCDYCGAPITQEPVVSKTGLVFCDEMCRKEFEGVEDFEPEDTLT